MDLAGKLIIKVTLGEDIRRIPIHNEDITYDELILMMQRVFKGRLNNSDELLVKYRDEDGDLVTIFDDSDLAFAIQCSKILKITLIVKGQQGSVSGPPLPFEDRASMRLELQALRDQINRLLDCLGDHVSASGEMGPKKPATNQKVDPTKSKEFDPLSGQPQQGKHQPQPSSTGMDDASQNKVMQSFGLPSSASGTPARPGTPDSQVSLSSSKAADASNGPARGPGANPPGAYVPSGQHQDPRQQQYQQQYPPPPTMAPSLTTDQPQTHQASVNVYNPSVYPAPGQTSTGIPSQQQHQQVYGQNQQAPYYPGSSPAHQNYYQNMPQQHQRPGQEAHPSHDQQQVGLPMSSQPGPYGPGSMPPHSQGQYAPPPPPTGQHVPQQQGYPGVPQPPGPGGYVAPPPRHMTAPYGKPGYQ